MKKLIYYLILAIIPLFANAQFTSDLVVFNPYGDAFKIYMGKKTAVNNYYANKVRVNDIQSGQYQLKISFQNNNIEQISQQVFIPENTEVAAAIHKNNDGYYYLEIFNAIKYVDNSLVNDNVEPDENEDYLENPRGFCEYPMEDAAFNDALQTIKDQDYDGDKLTIAQQIALSNCLLAKQIKQIIQQFDYESSKLDFAKFAYKHTYDPNNYFMINDAFGFSSSIQKLNDYISSIE